MKFLDDVANSRTIGLPKHVKELTLSLQQGLYPAFIKRNSFLEIQRLIRMFPKLCASRFHIQKLKIDYMTYFSDMDQYDKLVDRLLSTAKAENEPKGKCSQL